MKFVLQHFSQDFEVLHVKEKKMANIITASIHLRYFLEHEFA